MIIMIIGATNLPCTTLFLKETGGEYFKDIETKVAFTLIFISTAMVITTYFCSENKQ